VNKIRNCNLSYVYSSNFPEITDDIIEDMSKILAASCEAQASAGVPGDLMVI